MICKNCKREIADDSKFCVHCGAVQDEQAVAESAAAAAPMMGAPVATAQVEPQQAPQAAPQAVPQAVPQPAPQAAPQAVPQAAPQAAPQAMGYAPAPQPQQPQAQPQAQPAPRYGAPQPAPQAAPPVAGYAPPAQQPPTAAPAGFSPPAAQPAPTQQQYAAPPAGAGYAAPGYQQPVAAKKNNMPLFIGIGVAVIGVIVILIAVLGRGGGNDITGRYVLTRVEYQGTVLSGSSMESTFPSSENYIEITSSSRGRLTILGESISFTYRLNGNVLTIEDGTEDIVTRISNGKITFDYMGVEFEFTKE